MYAWHLVESSAELESICKQIETKKEVTMKKEQIQVTVGTFRSSHSASHSHKKQGN